MKEIPVVVFGIGGVGRALIQQIVSSRQAVHNRNHCRFNIVAVMDRERWLWQPGGLTDGQLEQAVVAKQSGKPIGEQRPSDLEILGEVEEAGLENGLVVDVTADNGMEPVIDLALEMGYGVVLANKKPLAGPWSTASRYFHLPQLRYESTVGGGQPVIATLRYLLDTNDPVSRIEGQLSGTLGYLCGRLDEDVPFSKALSEAKALGYTEPDPREDLGGRDVMRKIMILGRMTGWPLEETDIEVETLYDSDLARLTIEDFMDAIRAQDNAIKERVQSAAQAGSVLRYTAMLEEQGGSVGLKAIAKESPLANLKYISFKSGHYEDQPMMIGGKGAGVGMTAAGVLGDMIGLAREWLRPLR